VVSIDGNNALEALDFLRQAAHSVADVLGRLAAIAEDFERSYQQLVQTVMHYRLPTALCTIDDPRFPEQARQHMAVSHEPSSMM
jgi:hypothetical protein